MKIFEQSGERLGLRLARDGLSIGVCVFDRQKNAVTITRLALIIPYLRRHVPLSSIRGALVKRLGRSKTYYPTLELGTGQTLSIGGCSKEDALAAAQVIKDFLRVR